MRPLSTVEKPAFINLIKGLTYESVPIPNRKVIAQELENRFASYKTQLIASLKKHAFVCTTADIWTSNNRSYLGMTCHVISRDDFTRQSYVLACQRITGNHNFNKIASAIHQIHKDYEIDVSKISHTVTDSASNFGKAFRVFSINESSNSDNTAAQLHEDDTDGDPVQVVDIAPAFTTVENLDEDVIILPNQMKCAVHTMNLIATTDAQKASVKNVEYKKIHDAAFSKLQSFAK